jgi:hypothetical protein
VDGKQYIKVDHAANIRTNSAVSEIWQHGTELRLANDLSRKFWRCSHCETTAIFSIQWGTNAAIRHLRSKHKAKIGKGKDVEGLIESTSSSKSLTIQTALGTAGKVVQNLVTSLDINRFRWFLIRWIVCAHIALTCVEDDNFRDLLLLLAPALEPYLVRSANTIRRWIIEEFERQRLEIKKELATARTRIHISFDLWTSPNHRAICAVLAHFIGQDLKAHSRLIGFRRVRGAKSGENIAEVVGPVLEGMGVVENLGCFIGDNDATNDVVIRRVLTKLRKDIRAPARVEEGVSVISSTSLRRLFCVEGRLVPLRLKPMQLGS